MKTDLLALRHQQLRVELAGWASLIIAQQLYFHEVQMKAITRAMPSVSNLTLLSLATLFVLICLGTSLRLRWRQMWLTPALFLLCSCSAAGGYSRTKPDGTQVKVYAQAKVGTDTSGERQSADHYAAAVTNQSESAKATAKTAVTQTAIRAAGPVLNPIGQGVGKLLGQ